MSTKDRRTAHLTTADLYNLDVACKLIGRAFEGPPYLVGSAMDSRDFRDVDVRLILDDTQFDSLFSRRPAQLWELLSLALGDYLRQRTGLPIDFQIQRQTEANAKHAKPRNPLGMSRIYAGGGDAVPDAICGADPLPGGTLGTCQLAAGHKGGHHFAVSRG